MAVDFLSDADSRYFGDGILTNDDWGDPNFHNIDDFPSFLDTELSTDDLMREFREFNTGIPMFDDHHDILPLPVSHEEGTLNRSNSSDSGIASDHCSNNSNVKQEPLSPASSFSSDSDSSISNMDCQIIAGPNDVRFKLENPPLTPPRDPNDVISPMSVLNHPIHTTTISQSTAALNTNTTTKTEPSSSPTNKGISQILNNKVKIVPKPLVTTIPTTLSSGCTSQGKPLVLTPEEFARLTSQGVLKFQPPSADVKPLIKTMQPVTAQVAGNNPSKVGYTPEPSAKLMKRQQRMIKNRESACLSRRRKKEYVQSLEERMKAFNQENERLKMENIALKKTVDVLQKENEQLKKGNQSKRTTATFLLAVMLIFTMNIGPLSTIFLSKTQETLTIPSDEIHHGRTLLALIEEKEIIPEGQYSLEQTVAQLRKSVLIENATDYSELYLKSLETLGTLTSCKTYFNKTESLRLANELTGWVLGHKSEMKQKEIERAKKKKTPKKHRPLKALKVALENKLQTKQVESTVETESKNYQVQLFNSHERSYNEFLDAIQRRNDTFYVVSFRRDHLLLPATAHNKTMRPRMSLVMPAVAYNDSMHPPVGSVAMMQIDCEVMNTRLIHITKSTVPNYMWESNSTMPSPAEESEDDGRKWRLRYKSRRFN